MEQIEKIKFLEVNLSRLLDWIAAAESRTAFVFAVDTAMLGLLAAISPKSAYDWNIAPAVCASLAALFGLGALLFISLASFPRTTGPQNSLIFFSGIAQRDASQFEASVTELTQESYISDLTGQCHRNAEIATRKFSLVRGAIICLYLSAIPWGIAVYLLYNG